MSKKLLGILILAAVAAGVITMSGCGPKEALAPQLSGQASSVSLRYFPPQNMELTDVLMFMWKKDLSEHDVATVLTHAKLLDGNKSDIAPKVRQRNAFKERFAKVKYKAKDDQPEAAPLDIVDYSEKRAQLQGKQNLLTKFEGELKLSQATLEEAQLRTEVLKKKPASEVSKEELEELANLPKVIAEATSKIKSKTKAVERTKTEIAHALLLLAPTVKAVAEAGLEADVENWDKLEADLTTLRKLSTSYMVPINDAALVYDSSPMKFKFNFTREGLVVSINNWKLSEIKDPEIAEQGVPADFVSDGYKPQIRNVNYAPMGGIYTFDVITPSSVYWFKISRAKYEREGDGRLYFKGEIIRCSVENGYGWPIITYVRDSVGCGVNPDGAPIGQINQVGTPVIRRGAGNFVDKDDLRD